MVDTPGFKDTDDAEFVDELMNVLGDEVKEVDSFLIVYRYKDRFTRPFKRTLTMLTKMFGNFWTNVVLVVNFWSFKGIHVEEREGRGVTTKSYAKQLKSVNFLDSGQRGSVAAAARNRLTSQFSPTATTLPRCPREIL